MGGTLGSGARRPERRIDRGVTDRAHGRRRRRDPGERTSLKPRTSDTPAATPASRLSALRAKRTFRLVALRWAPAVAAAAIAYMHSARIGPALLIGVSVLAAAILLDPRRMPMQLMPVVALALRAAVPAVGVAAAFAVSLTLKPLSATDLLAPALGAWVVLALSSWELARIGRGIEVRLAVAGGPELAGTLARELERCHVGGYLVVGWIGAESEACAADGLPRLGGLAEVGEIVARDDVDLIVNGGERVAGEAESGVRSSGAITERIAEGCLGREVRMIHVNELYEQLFGHVPLARMNAAFFEYLMHPDSRRASPAAKRAMDLALSAVGALVALPLIAVAAVAIKLTDRGPVLYRQRRVGEGGREFEILKLRTMSVDAESDGAQWSVADDDRVTAVGRALRRLHLDELPQLWNVIRGEMSLVAPRPERPEMIAELEWQIPFYDRRELIKPGITGWAQVRCGYAGSDEGTAWKLCHDLHYLKRRSAALDMSVILETLLTAFRDARFEVAAPDERLVLDAVRGV